MRLCDLDTSAAQLRDAMKELQQAWQETEQQWNDEVSRKFCETHLEPIFPVLKLTQEAIGRMEQLVGRVQSDCEK